MREGADKQQQLERLLRNPRIRRAGRARDAAGDVLPVDVIPTGFAELDAVLNGGWPAAALTELLVDAYGSGELRLLMPALAAAARDQVRDQTAATAMNVWVAAPYIPYAPALRYAGLDPASVLLVAADSDEEALWSMEQALQSPACKAVLGWVRKASMRSLRRLQLAAEKNRCWVVAFRPTATRTDASVAALRIQLKATERLQLDVFKNRTGQPAQLVLQL